MCSLNSTGHSFNPGSLIYSTCMKEFCSILGVQVNLSSSGFHSQNCITSLNQSTRSTQLTWIKYAQNTMTPSAPGLFQFEALLGYQTPLFPAMPNPLRCCQRIWKAARAALLWTKDRNKSRPDQTPSYMPRQKVWLSTKKIPLRTESDKTSPNFIRPFEIEALFNLVSVSSKYENQ